jgi:L-alanine-DL-glutamate epimerase-like enolase superfamily enzyme
MKAYYFEYPLDKEFHPAWIPGHAQTANRCVILVIGTDQGIEGISAASVFNEEQARLAKFTAVDTIGRFFLSKDPAELETLTRIINMYGFVLGGRPWYIEVALWDLLAKEKGVPLYQYWGGGHRCLPLYASTGETATAARSPEKALAAREAGFRAIKLRAHNFDVADDIKAVEAVRNAVGDSIDILVDANQGWTLSPLGPIWDFSTALDFARAMEDLGVAWIEEPLDRFDFDGLRALRDSVGIPIAGGEMNQGMHEFRVLLEKDALDIYQPDATLAGGAAVARRVAQCAREKGRRFSPHTWTNGVGFAANMQIAAAEQCDLLEYPFEPDSWSVEARDAMLEVPFNHEHGGICLPELPGLGVNLSQDAMVKYARLIE